MDGLFAYVVYDKNVFVLGLYGCALGDMMFYVFLI